MQSARGGEYFTRLHSGSMGVVAIPWLSAIQMPYFSARGSRRRRLNTVPACTLPPRLERDVSAVDSAQLAPRSTSERVTYVPPSRPMIEAPLMEFWWRTDGRYGAPPSAARGRRRVLEDGGCQSGHWTFRLPREIGLGGGGSGRFQRFAVSGRAGKYAADV